MDDTTRYYKDPAKLIFELMQDTFKDRIRSYFLGSPISIAQSAYPCIVVQPMTSDNTVNGAPTGTDIVNEEINIHIMFLEQMTAVSQGTTDTVMRKLYNYVEGRDPATGFYMTGTVKYALRSNIELYNTTSQLPTTIDHDFHTDYAVTPNTDKAVLEAIITIKTEERVRVPQNITG